MTDDLGQRLERASAHIDSGFSAAQVERSLSSFEQRLARRKKTRQGLAAGALLSLCLIGGLALHESAGTLDASARVARQDGVRTRDGSHARPLEPDTQLQVQQDSEHEVSLVLARGAGHFDVAKRPSRRYRVHAGVVDVQVLGTVFDVRRDGARAQVSVTRGAVQVSWPGGQTILHPGDSEWFPRAAPSQPALPAQTAALPAQPAAHADAPLKNVQHDTWRALERAGKHKEAFRSLDRTRGAQVKDLDGLLLAADAARLSNHPSQAVFYLQRLVKHYPQTAPARLAAFTLGGLLLQDLQQPARAAESYARAYELDPDGPLAEDALAREAEALLRAGQPERAREVAAGYLARYPHGARRAELTRALGAK